jgi:hypothetical protein
MPTLTKARIGGNVVDAVGRDLAERLVLEVVHFHAAGIALRPPVAAGVAVVADQLLFLRVHGNDGLAARLSREDLGVDVFELGVAIGVAGALVRFPVDLPRETDLDEQLAHAVGADRVPHGDKRGRKLVEAFRHPKQRADRIAQRRRLDETPEIIEQRRVCFRQRSRAAAFPTNSAVSKRRPIKVLQSTPDGAARQSRDARQPTPDHPIRRRAPRSRQTAGDRARLVSNRPLPSVAESPASQS